MSRIKIGDVFEITTPKGKAYFQYVLKNREMGELIRILPNLYLEMPSNLSKIVDNNELFFVHFPLKAALKQKIVHHIDNVKLPNDMTLPQHYRTKRADKDGNLISWQIIYYDTWERETVMQLTEEQKKLSPWGTWNDTLLIERLCEGWTPESWK